MAEDYCKPVRRAAKTRARACGGSASRLPWLGGLLLQLAESVKSDFEGFVRMGGSDTEAQASGAQRHCREQHRRDEHSKIAETLCHKRHRWVVSKDYWNDRRFRQSDIVAQAAKAVAKKIGTALQALQPLGLGLQNFQSGERGSGGRRAERGGKDVRRS